MPSLKKGSFFSPDKYACDECNTEFTDIYEANSCEIWCLKNKPLKDIENQGIDIPTNIMLLIEEFLWADYYDRDKLVKKLGETGEDYVIPFLVEQLKTYKHSENVVEALGNIGSEKALDILVKIIEGKKGESFDFNPNNNEENSGKWSEYIEKDGTKSYFPWTPAENHKNTATKILIKAKYGLDSIIKSVILRFNHHSSEKQIENLKNIENEANEKLSEYLLDKNKLKKMLKENYDAYGKPIATTDKQIFLVEEYILKAIGATGGSKHPEIRNLTIRGIISTYYPLIGWRDLEIIRTFQTSEELLNALNDDKYILQYFNKEKDYKHISRYLPLEKLSDKEFRTIVKTGIVKALGILTYGKSVNSIKKIMGNIEAQAIDEKYKLMLIGACAEAFTCFSTHQLKGTLKALKSAKKFCENNYGAYEERYDALKHIHNALAFLGDKDSVKKIVRDFKSDEENSEVKKLIERIDSEILGEVFESLELYDDAEKLYTKNGMLEKSAEMRKKKAKMSAGSKTIVHGDYVDDRDTIVKDSVINRSSIGTGDKFTKLEKLAEMKKEGLIDDDEFKQMKKEILG